MIETLNTFLTPLENSIKKYRVYLWWVLYLLSLWSFYYVWKHELTKESGEQALNLLWIILWIPILARVLWLKIAQALMPLRKELGVLMWSVAFVHWATYFVPYAEELTTKWFWIINGFISYLAFGVLALLLTIPLTLTSNNWSMKLLWKNWKILHRSVYAIILLVVTHVVVLKWYLHFEFVPLIILCFYFIGKVLEWNGIKIPSKKVKVSYAKWQKWICTPCGFIYDPIVGDADSGILPGTEFSDIPETWSCPLCWVKKSDFIPYTEESEEATSIAIVKEAKMLNNTTIELTIETEEEHLSQPWQFMSFLFKDNDWQFPRTYSIAKQNGKVFTFLIKLSSGGRWAKCIEELEAGSVIRIRNISGNFILRETKNDKIFIATGTWLAPIYRMLLRETERWTGGNPILYFTVATKDELFYAEELRSIPNIELHIHISRENIDGYSFGRVDIDTIEAKKNSEWYLCGNPKMVSEAKIKLKEKWYENVFSEEF